VLRDFLWGVDTLPSLAESGEIRGVEKTRVTQLILLFIGGLTAFFLGLLHPVGPALFILSTAPFDPAMTAIFGEAGNYFSFAAPLLLLLRTSPGMLPSLFLGTRIQQATFVFFLCLLYGHMASYPSAGSNAIFGYLNKVNAFLMMGIVAMCMGSEKYLETGIKVLTVSMAAWATFCLAEFYLGIEVFPTRVGATDVITRGGEYLSANLYRLVGVGGSVPPNRLAMYFLPHVVLALGWINSPKATVRGRIIALGCMVVIGLALIGTISRAGYLGLIVAVVFALVAAGRIRLTAVLVVGLIGFAVLVGAFMAAESFGIDQALTDRVSGDAISSGADNRTSKWLHGLRLFADSPILGSGYGVGQTANVQIIGASDPHNAFIQVLAFYGMLGFIPLVIATGIVIRVLMLKPAGMPEGLLYWRPYFVAAILGTMTVCMFASFLYDRYLWYLLGFAIAWERAATRKIFEHTQAYRRWESGYQPTTDEEQDGEQHEEQDERPSWHPEGLGGRT
jgi:hypothetical protein